MLTKPLMAVVLIVIPAAADTRQFDKIRSDQVITVVLPSAQCEAKVISRGADQLTLEMKKTTSACGERHSLVTLSRTDIEDVIDERPPYHHHNPGVSAAGLCTVLATLFVAGSAGQAVGATQGEAEGIAVFAGTGAASAGLCYGVFFRRGPRYSVFTSRLTRHTTTAKVPQD